MFLDRINRFFPLHKLLKLLFLLAVSVQLIVITYNHFSGFYPIHSFSHLGLRLVRGTLLSLLAAFLIAIPDLYFIRYLNKVNPWSTRVLARVAIQTLLGVSVAVFVGISVTLFANWISPYTEDLSDVLLYNSLIYSVVNILLIVILEAWLFFMESNKARQKAENLEKELSQIRFEVLKSQINPHFMFNSLNVLSSLIDKDTVKAQLFIDEFSQIYRYVLETIEQTVVPLTRELDFVRSYIFLQQIRYGDSLSLSVKLSSHLLKMLLPPLSLQVVLENAIKHNIVNDAHPLSIEILEENQWLIVRNNIQSKTSKTMSTGLGQDNLSKRFAMIGKLAPRFEIENNQYVVQLPLISSEYDESINR